MLCEKYKGQKTEKDRNSIIVRTSIIEISTNVLLSVFKAAVGVITNSIAIVLDAVNNLSDAASGGNYYYRGQAGGQSAR